MKENRIVKYEEGQLQKLGKMFSLTNKLLGVDYRKLLIVHLDDHILLRKMVTIPLLKTFPNIEISEFEESELAFKFLKDCFHKSIQVDLIITDYNHLGDDGFLFAQKVRDLEKVFHIKIPIMLLTMIWENEILMNATKQGVFDFYKPKFIKNEELIKIVKEIANKKK